MDFPQMWKGVMILALMEEEDKKDEESEETEEDEEGEDEVESEDAEEDEEGEDEVERPGMDYSQLSGLLSYIALASLIIIAFSSILKLFA